MMSQRKKLIIGFALLPVLVAVMLAVIIAVSGYASKLAMKRGFNNKSKTSEAQVYLIGARAYLFDAHKNTGSYTSNLGEIDGLNHYMYGFNNSLGADKQWHVSTATKT